MRKVMLCVAAAVVVGAAALAVADGPTPLPDQHDPWTPWSLGPHAIPYEQLSAADQAGVDQLAEWVDTTHAPAMHAAWHTAAVAHAAKVQLELLERLAAMDGMALLGVDP